MIESYEVTIKGKTFPVKPIKDIGGHSIEQYLIHSGQYILSTPYFSKDYREQRMHSGQYAIECFASTGDGKMFHSKTRPSDHYMLNFDNVSRPNYKLKTIKNIDSWIRKNRSTLPFCPRWLQKDFKAGVPMALNDLARKQKPPIITEYPVLETNAGDLVSHYEHTIYIHDSHKEVLSFGDDY